jgi:DEAD/DEAH box helicase domain-containing protein
MRSGFDSETVATVATQSGFQIVEQVALPERRPSYLPVPESLHATVREFLESLYRRGLYSHQAEAVTAGLRGDDVCLATSTASGKSLVFMSVAADILLREERAAVLALYPARALIQDQLEKWRNLMGRLGLSLGFIDGGVAVDSRAAILRASRVVLMTPDVAHAWLLRTVGERDTARFLDRLKLIVLDEAHVYDGVFGTNMAYFLRRLQVVAAPFRIISSTATVGKPDEFLAQLTGRAPTAFGQGDDGSDSLEGRSPGRGRVKIRFRGDRASASRAGQDRARAVPGVWRLAQHGGAGRRGGAPCRGDERRARRRGS